MKMFLMLCISLLLLLSNVFADLSIMSFNIRYGSANDGENNWESRKQLLVDTIEKYSAGIIGMQEALEFQIHEITEHLPNYQSIGVGREDGKSAGEFSNILYDKNLFDVLQSGTFWLSDTPQVPGSITWGNACTRICTWAEFKQKATNKTFYVFNLHLDHISQPSREKSTALVLQKIKLLGDVPCFVTGDFNAGEANPAIQNIRKNSQLKDSFRTLFPDEEEVGTFNGYQGTTSGDKIDYVFYSPQFRVKSAAIIHDHKGVKYPSDHFPVIAEFVW